MDKRWLGFGGKRDPRAAGAVVLVLAFAVALRWYALLHTHIVNSDGVLYIYQAQALWQGAWDRLTTCGLSFVSSYALLIAGAYPLAGDWELAARLVALTFGSLTAVPLYLLLRRFVAAGPALGALVLFACMPSLVDRSVDVVRGPVAWFCAAWGLYAFVRALQAGARWIYALAALSFLAAMTARAEAGALLGLSWLYLACGGGRPRVGALVWFSVPLAVLGAAGAALFLSGHGPDLNVLRLEEVAAKFHRPVAAYQALRGQLEGLGPAGREAVSVRLFVHSAGRLAWLVGLGIVIGSWVKAVHYPLAVLFVLGLVGLRRDLKRLPGLIYLLMVTVVLLLLLYVHVLETWVIDTRFFALAIVSSLVWAALGLQRLAGTVTGRWHWRPAMAWAALLAAVLAVALPKDLREREADKVVYKAIGEAIGTAAAGRGPVRLAAFPETLRWIAFYANYHRPGPACPQPSDYDFTRLAGRSYAEGLENLRRGSYRYLVWEETRWPAGQYDFPAAAAPADVRILGMWRHADSGRIIVYELAEGR